MVWTIFSLLNDETRICTNRTWPNKSRVCQLVQHHPSALEFHIPPTNSPRWRAGSLLQEGALLSLGWALTLQHPAHGSLSTEPWNWKSPPGTLSDPSPQQGNPCRDGDPTTALAGQPCPWRNSSQHPVLLLFPWWICQDWNYFSKDWSKPQNSLFVQIKLVAEYTHTKKSLCCSWVVLNDFCMLLYSTFFFVSLLSHIIFMSLILAVPPLTHQSIPIAQKEMMTQTTPLIFFEEERGVFWCTCKMRRYQIEIGICLSHRKIFKSLGRNSTSFKRNKVHYEPSFQSASTPKQHNTDGTAEPRCSHHYLLPAHKITVAK